MPTTHRSIPIRKPALDLSESMARYYWNGNPSNTHFFNALNLLFPDGERFFVKSVYDHASSIEDPDLKREIRAFAGQEGQHAHQHERFFKVLEAQGYRTEGLLKGFRTGIKIAHAFPRALRLSITAGGEHLTAAMAALTTQHDLLHDADPTMRSLIEWHSLEEIEHKHVAYDVFTSSYRLGYPLRVLGYLFVVAFIMGCAAVGTQVLMAQDLRAGRLSRAMLREAKRRSSQARQGAYSRDLRRALLRYLKPGFHPNQQDDAQVLRDLTQRVEQTRKPTVSASAGAHYGPEALSS